MTKHFYHSSTKFFTALKPNSWVSSYKEDSKLFAVPWILDSIDESGRPKKILFLEKDVPEDSQLFIYKISTNDVIKTEANLGKLQDWMWQTTAWAKVELIEYYPSWHKLFGISSKEDHTELDREFENLKIL